MRVIVAQLIERKLNCFCNLHRASERRFVALEQARHLGAAFEVPLAVGQELQAGRLEGAALADTAHDVLQWFAVRTVGMDIVGDHSSKPQPASQRRKRCNTLAIIAGIVMTDR